MNDENNGYLLYMESSRARANTSCSFKFYSGDAAVHCTVHCPLVKTKLVLQQVEKSLGHTRIGFIWGIEVYCMFKMSSAWQWILPSSGQAPAELRRARLTIHKSLRTMPTSGPYQKCFFLVWYGYGMAFCGQINTIQYHTIPKIPFLTRAAPSL